jgi:hypothetical protein
MLGSVLEIDELNHVVRAGLGRPVRVVDVTTLRGGTKKDVYRVGFADDSTAVLYVWDPVPSEPGPLTDASGLDLFEAAHESLEALDIATPGVYFTDRSRSRYPADVALVQDVAGGSLDALLDMDPGRAGATLAELRQSLEVMHSWRGRRFGRLAEIESGLAADERSCEQVVLDRALTHLAAAVERVPRIAAVADDLHAALRELFAAIPPRALYGLIHGELGPDHVLVDEHGRPYLIDIEGLMYFDVEWEHVFLRIRFHEHYAALRKTGLDPARMRFYALATHLSLVAGPLRLLDGGLHDHEPMLRIAEHNVMQTLAFLP